MYERYHTFWQRFVASLIDGLVLSPATFPTVVLAGYGPRGVAIAWVCLTFPAVWVYTSFCHGRWGQTLGKRALGIAVRRASDEEPIGYRRAIRRDAAAIVFSLVSATLLVSVIATGNTEPFKVFRSPDFETATSSGSAPPDPWQVFKDSYRGSLPPWPLLVADVVQGLWPLAELVTMLSNPRRRAIHDLIGGTVVVKADPRGVPLPSS